MRAGLRREPWDAQDVISPSSKRHFGNSPALLALWKAPTAWVWGLAAPTRQKTTPVTPVTPITTPVTLGRTTLGCSASLTSHHDPTPRPSPSMDSRIPFWQRCGRALLIPLPVQPFLLLFSMRTGYVYLALISFFKNFSLCSWMNWLLLSSASLCRVSCSPNNQMGCECVYGFVINRLHTERCGVLKECVKRKWSKTWSWFWFNLNDFLPSRSGEIIWGRSNQTLILSWFSCQMSSP